MSQPNKLRRNHTFLTGVYLAVNAIRDLFLVIDGPNCIYKKADQIEKNHDYYSEIFSSSGHHRISSTLANVNNLYLDRTKEISSVLARVVAYSKSKAVLLTSMPVANITGVDYQMIVSEQDDSKPCIYLPYESLSLDWIDGYAKTIEILAKEIKLSDRRKKNSIGIVGYFFDRNEGDNRGNLSEINRLIAKMGLELKSVWLSGSSIDDLKCIEEAEYIISMPYAVEAANVIACKTGAKVIDAGLPFGIAGTEDWLLHIASATGHDAKKVIMGEKNKVLPVMEWLVPSSFQGKNFAVAGDPYFTKVLSESLAEIDVEVSEKILYSRPREIGVEGGVFDCDRIIRKSTPDLCIGNSDSTKYYPGLRFVEFGFPCYGRHCLFNQPFMGFRGFLVFLNLLSNEISRVGGI